MRVAIITELAYPHWGGCERRFGSLGRRFAQRGHEVHIFSIRHDKSLPKEERLNGCTFHRYADSENYVKDNNSRSLVGVLKYSLLTPWKLRKEDFDVYYFGQWCILHSIFSKYFVSPRIQEWCEVWKNKKSIVLLEKLLKRVTDNHVAVSEFTKDRLINFLGILDENITIIPDGINFKKLSRVKVKKKWGRIVYVGRLVPHKHLDLLFEAKKILPPETELHIVGDGELMPWVMQQASGLKNVYIHGRLPDSKMIRILGSSQFFVLASEREGFGIAGLEAMAMRTPVITTNYPDNGTKSLINGKNGVVVDPEPAKIAEAISSLLDDESRWKEMSEYAQRFAKEYDWELITDRLEGYIRQLVES